MLLIITIRSTMLTITLIINITTIIITTLISLLVTFGLTVPFDAGNRYGLVAGPGWCGLGWYWWLGRDWWLAFPHRSRPSGLASPLSNLTESCHNQGPV